MIPNFSKIINKLTGKEVVDSLIVANISSKNLFNKKNIIENYYLSYTDGTPTWDSNMCYMYDYIKVGPNTKYTMSYPTSTIFVIHEYDENKNFIRYQNQNNSNTSFTITTSSNTKFVRLSCGKNYIDKMQFEKYPIATDFSEHIDFEGNTKNIITTGTEFETGRIIDAKKEYLKRINCGVLLASGTKTVETGLSNVTYTDIEGICVTSGGGWPYKMGVAGSSTVAVLSIDNHKIKIKCNGDLSTYTGYVELKYFKN